VELHVYVALVFESPSSVPLIVADGIVRDDVNITVPCQIIIVVL